MQGIEFVVAAVEFGGQSGISGAQYLFGQERRLARPPPHPLQVFGLAGGDVVRVPAAHTLGDMLGESAHPVQIRHQVHPGNDAAAT
ncbi:hypothetical protein MLGJGCBP_08064 [Rhodococcus sp. T7]|nr:hypothetical protein MLGJGCBP_08975 [Rhodococcus sp. T7]KAF0958870.1 hypothetical protein MLGJGCBP_08064 [Rhodococcus sp. T7]